MKHGSQVCSKQIEVIIFVVYIDIFIAQYQLDTVLSNTQFVTHLLEVEDWRSSSCLDNVTKLASVLNIRSSYGQSSLLIFMKKHQIMLRTFICSVVVFVYDFTKNVYIHYFVKGQWSKSLFHGLRVSGWYHHPSIAPLRAPNVEPLITILVSRSFSKIHNHAALLCPSFPQAILN